MSKDRKLQKSSKYFIFDFSGPKIFLRLFNLVAGLVIFGIGIGIMVQSNSGVPPWDVLHGGLGKMFGGSIGYWSVVVSFAVMFLWIPLKEKIGIGTILNGIIIGLMIDLTGVILPEANNFPLGGLYILLGIAMTGLGTGLYMRAELGAGPRDGLMQGIAKQGFSIQLTRFILEATVLAIGIYLGGSFGWGTIAFTLFIGPAVQFFLTVNCNTKTMSKT